MNNSSASQSYYQPLDPSKSEIRLLEIVETPSDASSHTTCKFSTVSLDDKPQFAALSYVWGDPNDTESVVVNDVEVTVTASLSNALKHVKKHWHSLGRPLANFRLWADAICINQDDPKEKSSQVQLMRTIYSSADVVFAWLSSDDGPTATALDMLDKTYRLAVHHMRNEPPEPVLNHIEVMDWSTPYESRLKENKLLDTIDKAFGVPKLKADSHPAVLEAPWWSLWQFSRLTYWERVWIFQENMLARQIYYACPSRICHADSAAVAFGTLRNYIVRLEKADAPSIQGYKHAYRVYSLRGSLSGPMINHKMRRRMAHARQLEIMARITCMSCGGYAATDPRDHVYGFLGVSQLDITPNYTMSPRDVYADFARVYVETCERLDYDADPADSRELGGPLVYLQYCAAGVDNDMGLPSWAPSFQIMAPMLCREPSTMHNYGVDVLRGTRRIAVRGETLDIPAVVFQKVTVCYDHELTSSIMKPEFPRFLDRMARSHEPTYPTNISFLSALCRTLFDNFNDDDSNSLRGLAACLRTKYCWQDDSGPLFDQLKESLDSISSMTAEEMTAFGKRAYSHLKVDARSIKTCALIGTEDGYIGLVRKGATEGDVVSILRGASVPVVLRPEKGFYQVVSPCTILGLTSELVNGFVREGKAKMEVLEVR